MSGRLWTTTTRWPFTSTRPSRWTMTLTWARSASRESALHKTVNCSQLLTHLRFLIQEHSPPAISLLSQHSKTGQVKVKGKGKYKEWTTSAMLKHSQSPEIHRLLCVTLLENSEDFSGSQGCAMCQYLTPDLMDL